MVLLTSKGHAFHFYTSHVLLRLLVSVQFPSYDSQSLYPTIICMYTESQLNHKFKLRFSSIIGIYVLCTLPVHDYCEDDQNRIVSKFLALGYDGDELTQFKVHLIITVSGE